MMKQTLLPKVISGAAFTLLFGGMLAGCAEKNLYDENWRKSQLPPEEAYFNFEMRGSLTLKIDYSSPGFQSYIEVYDQDPMITKDGRYVKDETITPIYSAYTDKDGKLDARMNPPTSVKEAYLYTDRWGLPQCVKMQQVSGGFAYGLDVLTPAIKTRVADNWFINTAGQSKIPYSILAYENSVGLIAGRSANEKMTSICKWQSGGKLYSDYISYVDKYNGEPMLSIAQRAGDLFSNTPAKDRSKFLGTPALLNITTTKSTKLDVTLLVERGEQNNTLGYYYYKLPSNPNGQLAEYVWEDCVKYIIFPNASIDDNTGLKCGATARLKFFGEKYDQEPQDEFPKDYVIGWFYIPNGYNLTLSSGSSALKDWIAVSSYSSYNGSSFVCSNETATSGKNAKRFVTVYDQVSDAVVLGFEDHTGDETLADDDYSDVLYLVKANQKINTDDRPILPPTEVVPEPEPKSETITGVLSFEDIWPSGGDYDLNDVVVKYQRDITFVADAAGKNYATKIVETFTPIHDGASLNNAFGFQVQNLGKVTAEGCIIENETNSIILGESLKQIQKKSFTITRTFDAGTVTKDDLSNDFNPYIIIKGYSTNNRAEVHLPKHLSTELANKDLQYTSDDAYFIDKGGQYPFAIDIPYINYKVPVVEKKRIDEPYPEFKGWAESKGTKNKEWYKNYQGE